jgi:putative ABC transport system permease protein
MENYVGVTVYIAPQVFSAGFGNNPSYNTVLAHKDIRDPGEQDAFVSFLLAEDGVLAAEFISQIQSSYNNLLTSINFIVMAIIFASGALAMIVLYNLTNINIGERTREIATLRVLGFHKSEAASYIFREITILSVFGIIAGLFLGVPVHRFIIGVAENPDLMFGRHIVPLSFIMSGIITVVFSAGVDLFMLKKLGSIKMAESMKGE